MILKDLTPVFAIAFVRLDGVDSAIANYIEGLDMSNVDTAMKSIMPGARVRVEFIPEPEGRVTDFHFVLA